MHRQQLYGEALFLQRRQSVQHRVAVSYTHLDVYKRQAHDTTEVAGNGCVLGSNNAVINITVRTVNGDVVALVIGLACQSELLLSLIHI